MEGNYILALEAELQALLKIPESERGSALRSKIIKLQQMLSDARAEQDEKQDENFLNSQSDETIGVQYESSPVERADFIDSEVIKTRQVDDGVLDLFDARNEIKSLSELKSENLFGASSKILTKAQEAMIYFDVSEEDVTIASSAPVNRLMTAGEIALYETTGFFESNYNSQFQSHEATPIGYSTYAPGVHGNYAVISDALLEVSGVGGAGSVYVYDITTNALLYTLADPTVNSNGNFGNAVSVYGNYALVGNHGDDNAGLYTGEAYLYDLTTGNLAHTFTNPTGSMMSFYGDGLYMNGDHIVIGAPGYNDVGGSLSGLVYVHDASDNSLLYTIHNPSIESNDLFGADVKATSQYIYASSQNDNTGGTRAGQGYLFDITDGSLLFTFSASSPNNFDNYGTIFDITDDYVVIADPKELGFSGYVDVYSTADGSLITTITGVDGVGASFGTDVSIQGEYLVVSADSTVYNGESGVGAVHIFDITTGTLLETIYSPVVDASVRFGSTIASTDTTLLVSGKVDPDGVGTSYSAVVEYIVDFNDTDNIIGTALDDMILGLEGNDFINAGAGDDRLYGGNGDDVLRGGADDDMLIGGAGIDVLVGGTGADIFVLMADDAFTERDVIQDFDLSEGDMIDISDVLDGFDPLTDLVSDFVRLTTSGSNAILEIDATGAGDGAVFVAAATITGGASLDLDTIIASGGLDMIA